MIDGTQKPFWWLCATVALFAALLLAYSQTLAFAWDEGFHLLTAQLIKSGKRPYIDFCFPQTPLNAYWNAAWMSVFGESWRPAHAVAAVDTAGAILLTGGFLLTRLPIPGLRLAPPLSAVASPPLEPNLPYLVSTVRPY